MTTTQLSSFGMSFYNNLLSLPLIFAVTIVNGELGPALSSPVIYEMHFLTTILFSGIVGCMVGFSAMHCVKQTSPVTYCIVGTLNKIWSILFGVILFGSQLSFKTGCFVFMNLFGGFLYGWTKMKEKEAAKSKSPLSTTANQDNVERAELGETKPLVSNKQN